MNTKVKSLLAGAVLGASVFYIAAFFILGYTAAIVLPGSIADWAQANSMNFPVLFMWELLVVQLLGVGILAAIASYLAVKLVSFKWLYLLVGFVVTDILLSYFSLLSVAPALYFSSAQLISFLPHFMAVLFCVLLGARSGARGQKI